MFNGGNATGTAGPITSVVGTLVCNPGATGAMGATQIVIDTPAAALSPLGNAELSFRLTNVPANCASPLFLIRIPQFGLRWIATGILPVTMSRSSL